MEGSSSPTAVTKPVFLTTIIDPWENQKVAAMDVPGAFTQADMDECVQVFFHGEMEHHLLEINEELYLPYVMVEKGVSNILYNKRVDKWVTILLNNW